MDREYLETLLRDLGQMLTSETVIGEPLTFGKVTIVPVVSVSFGFGSAGGGTKPASNDKQMNATGSTAGAKLTPVAFLSIHEDGSVNLHQIQTKEVGGPVDRLLEMAPGFIDKLTATLGKGKGKSKASSAVEPRGQEDVNIGDLTSLGSDAVTLPGEVGATDTATMAETVAKEVAAKAEVNASLKETKSTSVEDQ